MESWSTTDPDGPGPHDPGRPVDRLAELTAELREAERLIDELFRSNPEPMWIVDLETLRFLDVNAASVAKYGYTREQFLQMTLADVRPDSELEAFWAQHRRIAGSSSVHLGQVLHRRVDGSLVRAQPTIHEITYQGRRARVARLRLLTDAEVEAQAWAAISESLVERLGAIIEVWRELSERRLSVAELLDTVPEVTLGLLGAEGVIVYVPEGDQLVALSATGVLGATPTLPIDRSLAGWAYVNGVATRSDDDSSDPRSYVPDGWDEPARALAVAPIEGVDGPFAVIVAVDRRLGHFDEVAERTLDLLARSLGTLARRIELEASHLILEERLQLVVNAATDSIYD